jgi:CheY-like chemotaxis protein
LTSGRRQIYDNFKDGNVFWINDIDKTFYSTDNEPYVVNPEDPDSYWYNMTLYETDDYNFNINYNADIDETMLWVNMPVFSRIADGQKAAIGMLGTGIRISEFSEFVASAYQEFDANITPYMFNSKYEITSAMDYSLVYAKTPLTARLGDAGAEIVKIAAELSEAAPKRTFEYDGKFYLLNYLPEMDWYLVVSYPYPGLLAINDVTVESVYGTGSTFTATIMQEYTDSSPMGEINSGVNLTPETQQVRFSAPFARILIVDDIATNLKVMEGLLAPYKLKIDVCLSGRKAIQLAREYSYDFIFMDHMMPEMDGIEATAAIREENTEVPIIALTANAISGMREMFLKSGFNDYLTKPIEVGKLTEILEKWIPKEKREKAGPTAGFLSQAISFEITGIDTKRGLMMTGGTEKGYKEVLH